MVGCGVAGRLLVGGGTRAPTEFAEGAIATWSAPKGTAVLLLDPNAHSIAKRNNLGSSVITDLSVVSEADDALCDLHEHTLTLPGLALGDATVAGSLQLGVLKRNAPGAQITGDCCPGPWLMTVTRGRSPASLSPGYPDRVPVSTFWPDEF